MQRANLYEFIDTSISANCLFLEKTITMAACTFVYLLFYLLEALNIHPFANNQSVDYRHIYDPGAELQCHFKSISFDNFTDGYLKIVPRISTFDLNRYTIEYQIDGDTGASAKTMDTGKFEIDADGSLIANWRWYGGHDGFFHLKIGKKDSQEQREYQWQINQGDPLMLKKGATEWPLFDNYISLSDTFQIESLDPDVDKVFLYYYGHDFDPARPPISSSSGVGNRTLQIDSMWSMPAGQKAVLHKTGLYFIQSDSSSNTGISVRVTDDSYPKPGKIESLVAPLIYITTKAEYLELQAAENKKKSFDKFWLEQTKSEAAARNHIKAFFQRLSWSNRIFTSYKEGWKTDRGMIFIIFGLPIEAHRYPDREEWIYQKSNGDQVIFTFLKVPNIFSEQHYELIRRNDYDSYWFAAIEDWRKGALLFR